MKVERPYPADIDTDGDVDVLLWLRGETSEWLWVENLDGQGIFVEREAIPGTASPVPFDPFVDYDGDGDMDLLGWGGLDSHVFYLYENSDGAGEFSPPKALLTTSDSYLHSSGEFADLDEDGDMDFLAYGILNSESPDRYTLMWYENLNGDDEFSEEKVIERSSDFRFSQGADLDSDGDIDVVASGANRDEEGGWIHWHENTDGLGTLSESRIIAEGSATLAGLTPIDLCDVDGDSDIDVVARTVWPGTIVWFENINGHGTFTGKQKIIESSDETSVISVFGLVDMDGDTDIDVLSRWGTCTNTSTCDPNTRIAWYEQRLIGDSNDDGVFDSSDIVKVFVVGKYEDGIPGNATFDEGDWNQDGDFDSLDMVMAFQAGVYEQHQARSEITAAVDWLFTQDQRARRPRAYVA